MKNIVAVYLIFWLVACNGKDYLHHHKKPNIVLSVGFEVGEKTSTYGRLVEVRKQKYYVSRLNAENYTIKSTDIDNIYICKDEDRWELCISVKSKVRIELYEFTKNLKGRIILVGLNNKYIMAPRLMQPLMTQTLRIPLSSISREKAMTRAEELLEM